LAQLELARVEVKRERDLLARRATAQEDLDRKEAQRKRSEAQVEADKANLEQAKADYQTNILSARASVESARSEVRNSEIALGSCGMSAPIEGRIGQALVKLGNLVGATENTELASIQQLNPMGVEIRPSARYLPIATQLIQRGLIVRFAVQG